jgi:hypothetical protein
MFAVLVGKHTCHIITHMSHHHHMCQIITCHIITHMSHHHTVLVGELDFEHASHIGVHPHQPVGFSLGLV